MDPEELIQLRKYLHQNPELSGIEKQTTQYFVQLFEEHCPSAELTVLGDTGLLARFKGTSDAPKVMLRCELDALAIKEINEFDYKSKVEGVSHKCGHDGHMTILFSTALKLEKEAPKGDVFLIFQPAEETGEGAIQVVENELFREAANPNYVFALHNLPGSELHSIHIKPEECTPSVVSATVYFNGKTSHAAEPQKGHNPAFFVSEVELYANAHSQTDPTRDDFKVITPIFIEIGSKDFGISAGSGSAGFTLRTLNNHMMGGLKDDFISLLDHLSNKYHIPYRIEWSHSFFGIYNTPECAEMIVEVARELELPVKQMEAPFPWGEDFGYFTESFKGALFGLGAGESCPALHNPDYDFPDELITTGTEMFTGLIKKVQK